MDTASSICDRLTGLFSTANPSINSLLHSGDRLQLGQTVMLFHSGSVAARPDLIARVDLLAKSSPDDRSAILKSIPSDEDRACSTLPTPRPAGSANVC